MPLPLTGLVLALVSLAPPAQDAAATRFIPPDAALLIRFESAQAWNQFVHAFAPLVPDAATYDLQGMFDEMASAEAREHPATLAKLDPTRPLYVAFSFEAGGEPGMTLLAPSANDQPFQFDPSFGPTTSRIEGGYTVVTNRPAVTTHDGSGAALAALRPGLVSLHVDLANLIATYRPLIDMGLRQAEMMMDEVPGAEMTFDLQPLMEAYLDLARGLLDAAEGLDLALVRNGEELALRFDYTEKSARPFARSAGDVGPLLGFIDPAASIQMAYGGKWTEYFLLFEDFLEGVLAIYPEPLRADLERLFTLQKALDPLLAPGAAMGVGFGAGGPQGSYVMRSTDPEALVSAIEGLVRALDHEGGFVRIGAVETLAVEGLAARVLPVEFHFESLTHLFAGLGGTEPPPPEALQGMVDTLAALYGRSLRIALATAGERVLVVFDREDAGLRAGLARLTAPATPSPKLLALLARIEPGTVGFAYHFDIGQAMGQAFEAVRDVFPAQSLPPAGFSLGSWMAVRDRTWSGGMVLRIDDLIRYAQGLRAGLQR